MTEYEITFLISEYVNRQWGVMQFWASISFGLMAASHFSAKHLNLLAVVVISTLYVSFSIFVLNILKMNGIVVNGYIGDLKAMIDAGLLSTMGATMTVNVQPGAVSLLVISFTYIGTFAASLAFLWGTYILAHKKKRSDSMRAV